MMVIVLFSPSWGWADQSDALSPQMVDLCVARSLALDVVDQAGISIGEQAFPVLLRGHRLVSIIGSSELADSDIRSCGKIKEAGLRPDGSSQVAHIATIPGTYANGLRALLRFSMSIP